MPVDHPAAEDFVLANARLLERHRLGALIHDAPLSPVLAALRAYRNDDGGFGHALEPDVRAPHSEPASVLHALEVLADARAAGDPMVAGAAGWVAGVAGTDGAVPFVLDEAASYPHAPWMTPTATGSFLTYAIVARLHELGHATAWRDQATRWCWEHLAHARSAGAYWIKFALDFLDHVPDDDRLAPALDSLGSQLGADGSVPVPGGTADERLGALDLSPRPGLRSRALFDGSVIERGLDALEAGQTHDGGWTFDWLAWSAGQSVEWRGIVTYRALATLAAHRRG